MMGCFPTVRGWIVFLLGAFAVFFCLAISPVRYVQSGVGEFLAAPVTASVSITGVILVIISSLASIEAFRRGSRTDKILAGIAVFLTIGLLVNVLELFTLPVFKPPGEALKQMTALVRRSCRAGEIYVEMRSRLGAHGPFGIEFLIFLRS